MLLLLGQQEPRRELEQGLVVSPLAREPSPKVRQRASQEAFQWASVAKQEVQAEFLFWLRVEA